MPHFTLQIVPEGPVISLLVGASAPRVTALQNAGLPVPQAVVLRCLIDTGASGTCVDGAAIAPLGLTATGSTFISTPSTGGTPHQCATYDVGMMFVHSAGNRFFGTVAVVATDFSAQPIDGLLGRDVLSSCLLVYDGAAKIFSIAFWHVRPLWVFRYLDTRHERAVHLRVMKHVRGLAEEGSRTDLWGVSAKRQ